MTRERAALRARLLALRADLLRQMGEAQQLDPGYLGLLPGIAAPLAVLDEVPSPETASADRVVLADDGETIYWAPIAAPSAPHPARCPRCVQLSWPARWHCGPRPREARVFHMEQ
jgi:hypothetical protein